MCRDVAELRQYLLEEREKLNNVMKIVHVGLMTLPSVAYVVNSYIAVATDTAAADETENAVIICVAYPMSKRFQPNFPCSALLSVLIFLPHPVVYYSSTPTIPLMASQS